MAFDSVDQLLANSFVAGGPDMGCHLADVLAGLFDVDGHRIALRILGGHLPVQLRVVADYIRQL